jgi:hypothetical protein|tara:strand:+ start:332 stop:757 length:426 start_codon:yes stop_codon:yes gene_type:complete
MLAEIAIANAAFGVIKEAIGNGKDLYEMGSVVSKFFDSKTELQRKAHKGGYKADMEAFMELEKVKEMEEHIKQQMIWAGRPGMWDDWLAFQKAAKEERQKREAEERARREELKQLILYTLYAVCGLAVFVPTLFIILTILK